MRRLTDEEISCIANFGLFQNTFCSIILFHEATCQYVLLQSNTSDKVLAIFKTLEEINAYCLGALQCINGTNISKVYRKGETSGGRLDG